MLVFFCIYMISCNCSAIMNAEYQEPQMLLKYSANI